MSELAQQWLTRRLAGLEPSDFVDGILFFCTAALVPPASFQQAWIVYQDHLGSPWPLERAEEMSQLPAIPIFCDPSDDAQVASMSRIVQAIDGNGQEAPPIIWVPHTVPPDAGQPSTQVDPMDPRLGGVIGNLLHIGLDGLVPGEPEGHMLALVVRARLRKLATVSRTLNDVVNERRSRARYVDQLRECMNCTLWQYSRSRLAPCIPPIDPALPSGELRRIDGFDVGAQVGQSLFGRVCRLQLPDGNAEQNGAGQHDGLVAKVLDKSKVVGLHELKFIRRQLDVLQLLSKSEWAHPNLIQLQQIYHTSTHIIVRMDLGGRENLHQRLLARQAEGDDERPLPEHRCLAVVEQAINALAHIHLGPEVCHRDIKTENFAIRDADGEPRVLKLADFEWAIAQPKSSLCRSKCGTVPFVAPEVVLQREWDGMASDVRSLGIVLLELLCGTNFLERHLSSLLARGPRGRRFWRRVDDPSIGQMLRHAFQNPSLPSVLLQAECRPELQSLVPAASALVDGMVEVQPRLRWDATKMRDGLEAFPRLSAQQRGDLVLEE